MHGLIWAFLIRAAQPGSAGCGAEPGDSGVTPSLVSHQVLALGGGLGCCCFGVEGVEKELLLPRCSGRVVLELEDDPVRVMSEEVPLSSGGAFILWSSRDSKTHIQEGWPEVPAQPGAMGQGQSFQHHCKESWTQLLRWLWASQGTGEGDSLPRNVQRRVRKA